MKKDFLTLAESDAAEITTILDRADDMKKQIVKGNKKMDILEGRSVVTLFYENSTRTRCSFDAACKYLGATVIDMSVSGSSVTKGESLVDTAITLDRMMADAIIIRHSVSGAPAIIAKHTAASVVNGGDGMHAHPTQALLDMLTMRAHFGGLKGLEVAIIGDIKHSRVARSNIVGLVKMGARVKVFGPNTLIPHGIEDMPCRVCESIEDAFTGSDVVMGLRIQLERQQRGLFPSVGEYAHFYGITPERLKMANKGAVVMHPGPVNRGVEIAHGVFDMPCCVKDEQVTGGVAVRMALLETLLNGRE